MKNTNTTYTYKEAWIGGISLEEIKFDPAWYDTNNIAEWLQDSELWNDDDKAIFGTWSTKDFESLAAKIVDSIQEDLEDLDG